MSSRKTQTYDLGVLAGNGEATNAVLSIDYRNAVFTLIAEDSSDYTIQFYASNQYERPDFSIPVSDTNIYTETQVVDLNDGKAVDGTEGAEIKADYVKQFEVNQNLNRWLGCKITSYTSGTAHIQITLGDNQ